MRDLVTRLWCALKELAAAPLDWNGYEMAVLGLLAIVVYVLALLATGGIHVG